MNNKILLLLTIFAMQNATYALAADAIYAAPEAPVYEETFSWNGAYIGAQAGFSAARNKLSFTGLPNEASANSNGFVGGIFAGYNWAITDTIIYGLEGDINFANLKKDTTLLSNQNANFNWNIKTDFEGAIRARLGVSYQRWLPYIAGGVSIARLKDSFSLNNATNTVPVAESTTTRVGFTIGAGVDYAVTDNILLRAEYRYNDYGKKSISADNLSLDRKLSSNNVRLGIAYKF
ncbi:outer membrane protein [Pseudochrobactrum asaccharolyticum]|uniref:Outer membrane immunogenic protein n=1 Tax=Pseudochrobactrum asaccharolyticum TaxID=354351 RepID=A0A366E0J1_9HYPH|nr:outer membrane protein [Pseudochrobactrum asaccharolyticum]RBO95890.1 outer membrane immunogenic protein [Pseudochrobactrum asaccharolyticum]